MPDKKVNRILSKNSLKCDLQFAIHQKDIDGVKNILKKANRSHMESMLFIGMSTPLGYAIYQRFDTCVRLLLEEGVNPNELTTDCIGRAEPPLCVAIRMDQLNITRMLLEHPNTNVNRSDNFLQTPVYLTVRYRRPEILQLILKHKHSDLKIETRMSMALNPLYLSARLINKKRIECFRILLNVGYEVKQTIIDILLESGNEEAIRLAKMSIGKTLSIDDKSVLTLKQLCRVVLRNQIITNTNLPIVRQNISLFIPYLPYDLVDFLIDLHRYK